MALTLDGLKLIADRHGNQFVADTIQMAAPLLADEKCLEHRKAKGVEIINVRPNGMIGGSLSDGGSYVQNTSFTYTQLYATLVPFASQIKIAIGAAEQVSGSAQSIDLVADMFRLGIEVLGYGIENQLLDRVAGTVTTGAAIAASAVTLSFDDVSRFRVGNRYVWNDNGVKNANLFTVTSVTVNADGVTGDVAFSTAATGTPAATDDNFLFDDANGSELTSFVDLSAGESTHVYTQSADIAGWAGTQVAQGGAFTAGGLNKLISLMSAKGRRPDRIAMNPQNFRIYEDAMAGSAFRRFNSDQLDPYGKFHDMPEFSGVKIKITPNAPAIKTIAWNSQSSHLGVWNKIGPIGGEKYVVAQTSYNYLVTAHAQMELINRQRKDVGALTGLTYA